ncbi:MAG TPA: TerB family tellurite resistance protein [Flavobacteriales bacterium]
MSFGKWIGGVLGWAMGGPIGGIIGFALGSIADDKSFQDAPAKGTQRGYQSTRSRGYEQYRHHTSGGDFASALLILSAAVMKADNRLLKVELEYIRSFFKKQFGDEAAIHHIGVLKNVLKQDIPLRQVCEQIRYYMEHSMRLQLMYYLFGIANADGNVDTQEIDVLERMAAYMGINEKDFDSLKAMYFKQDDTSMYKILEISPDATDEEVKKAYRKMAMKYHPDKLRNLGPEHEKAANEKFQEVQKAYDRIKKLRGFK